MNKKQSRVKARRIQLNRETIVNLTSDLLKQVAGGAKPTTQHDTECYTGCDEAC